MGLCLPNRSACSRFYIKDPHVNRDVTQYRIRDRRELPVAHKQSWVPSYNHHHRQDRSGQSDRHSHGHDE